MNHGLKMIRGVFVFTLFMCFFFVTGFFALSNASEKKSILDVGEETMKQEMENEKQRLIDKGHKKVTGDDEQVKEEEAAAEEAKEPHVPAPVVVNSGANIDEIRELLKEFENKPLTPEQQQQKAVLEKTLRREQITERIRSRS